MLRRPLESRREREVDGRPPRICSREKAGTRRAPGGSGVTESHDDGRLPLSRWSRSVRSTASVGRLPGSLVGWAPEAWASHSSARARALAPREDDPVGPLGRPHVPGSDRRELEAMRRATRPHTAALLESDLDGDPAWFAMEFIPGMTLTRRVTDRGPRPRRSWLSSRLVSPMCSSTSMPSASSTATSNPAT